MKTMRLSERNWEQVKEYLKDNDTLILPVGSQESHGTLLPEGTDSLVGIRIAEEAGQRTGVLVAPPLWYGYTPHHLGHAGTASLSAETYIAVIKEICCSYIYHGFKKIVIVNGHRLGNTPLLQIATTWLRNITGAFMEIIDPFYIAATVARNLRTNDGSMGHAGDIETSHMLYLFPDLVDMNKAVRNVSQGRKFHPADLYSNEDRVLGSATIAEYNKRVEPSGTTGDAPSATKEKGEAYHKQMIDNMVEVITEAKARKVKLTGTVPLPY